ncbi:hypothetical protein PIB30_073085 [Stylosanthes scabra]|uniref:Heparan-alpha-glucosaminide N-acetyltransferase n=1 Tax=Stylosanthes scabra TaxID=79078 RepID=A0ABU6VMX5_9FABA|nr:hypothetical protein [Stylosanthes scabra]
MDNGEAKRMEEGLNDSITIDHDEKDKTVFSHEEDQAITKHKTKRVVTLDAFRGFVIVVMILVDDAGGAYPQIDHSPWNGCTLADFVMPFFLFIVGIPIALALKRIGVVYCVVALIETFTTKIRPTTLWQWFGGFVAFVIYMVTTFSLYVPNWSFVDYNQEKPKRYTECTLSSPWEGHIRKDAPAWCRAPFEPEGFLSSISAILSGTIGIHYGHVLIHFKSHSERLKQWLSMGFVLLILGIIFHSSYTASAMFVSQQG